MQLHDVVRLPVGLATVAIFTQGHGVDADEFHAAVCSRLLSEGVVDMPALELVYRERWKFEEHHRYGRRFVRCRADDEDGFDVTGVDLRKWSRGRMPQGQ